jgi:flagellar secretion chaperone FliS
MPVMRMPNPYLQRLDEEIYCADPIKLVVILNRSLCQRIMDAREALSAGQIRARADAISQAIAIIGELAQSLKPAVDPEMASRLQGIYGFMVERLLHANSEQLDAPLEEVLRVANVLVEAWSGISHPDAIPQPVSDFEPAGLSCSG